MKTTAEERASFAAGLRAFLETRVPESEVRRLAEDDNGVDATTLSALNDQFGLGGLVVPEAYGGQELGASELAVALAEGARVLLPAPVLSAAIAAFALRLAGGDAAGALLRDLSTGTVVVYADQGTGSGDVTAKSSGPDWVLGGTRARVTDAQVAQTILLTATVEDSTALFAVDPMAAGVLRKPLTTLDLTRRQSSLVLDQAAASLVAEDFGGRAVAIGAVSAVLSCAELRGAAERSLELATQYAKDRTQFGVPIGSFQAIKHLLAESLAAVEQMRAAVTRAAAVVDEFVDGAASESLLLETASVTKAYCSTAAPRVVETLIQVLGGIGYTWEHPAHLYLRRVRSLSAQFGDAREHRAALAARFGLVSA